MTANDTDTPTDVRIRDPHFILFDLGAREFAFKGLGFLLLVYIGSLLFAALFSPLLYTGIQPLYY